MPSLTLEIFIINIPNSTGHILFLRCRELECTSSQADNGPQAVPFPHDDGGQDLAPQEAVLDACRQCVEALVTQHGDLVMQSASSNRKLKKKSELWD